MTLLTVFLHQVNVAFQLFMASQFIRGQAAGILTALIKEVTNQRPHPLAPLHITQNTPTGGILSNNLATKSIQELFYLKNHWCKRKKKCFYLNQFLPQKNCDIQICEHCKFFQIGCEKDMNRKWTFKFFFWLCTIPSLFFYYPVCFIQRILKRRSEFWPFFYWKHLQKFSL